MKTTELFHIHYLKSLYWSCKNNSQKMVLRKLINLLRYHSGVIVFPGVNFKSKNGNIVVKDRLVLGKVRELESYKRSDLRLI